MLFASGEFRHLTNNTAFDPVGIYVNYAKVYLQDATNKKLGKPSHLDSELLVSRFNKMKDTGRTSERRRSG